MHIVKGKVRKKGIDKIIYTNITDIINKKPYLVKIPTMCLPMSLYFIENNAPPIEECAPHELCVTRAPIRHLINLNYNKVVYEIIHDEDVIDILDNLYKYIHYAESIQHLNPDIEQFLNRVRSFLKEVYFMYTKIEKKHIRQNKPLKRSLNPLFNALKLFKIN